MNAEKTHTCAWNSATCVDTLSSRTGHIAPHVLAVGCAEQLPSKEDSP